MRGFHLVLMDRTVSINNYNRLGFAHGLVGRKQGYAFSTFNPKPEAYTSFSPQ